MQHGPRGKCVHVLVAVGRDDSFLAARIDDRHQLTEGLCCCRFQGGIFPSVPDEAAEHDAELFRIFHGKVNVSAPGFEVLFAEAHTRFLLVSRYTTHKPAKSFLRDGSEEVFLVCKVTVDRCVAHPDDSGHFAKTQCAGSLRGEDTDPGRDQLRPEISMVVRFFHPLLSNDPGAPGSTRKIVANGNINVTSGHIDPPGQEGFMSYVGTKYRAEIVDASYDAVIIGSGMGSLSTAALLSKAGKKVLVLEKHYTAGGFTHSYSRKGYEWDVGVHYIGEVHKKLSPLRMLFDLVTDGKLEWSYMEETYDRVFFGKDRYDFIAGEEKFKESLLRHFPAEKEALKNYLKLVKTANNLAIPFFVSRKIFPDAVNSLTSSLSRSILDKYVRRTTGQVLEEITGNAKLRGVLAAQWGDYGLPPGESSFMIHAAVAHHYMDGGNFPVGGASQIARTIEAVIEKSGGKVLVNAGVSEILVRNGSAFGVRLENGHEICADRVISGAGCLNTFGRLLSDENAELVGGRRKLGTIRPSIGHICLYTGMKHTAKDLNLPTGNLWLYGDYDHDAAVKRFLVKPTSDFPLVYISFPSAKDPQWETQHPGKSTIDVIAPAPYSWFEKWKGTPWRKRGADYVDYKEELSQKLLEHVYAHVPQTKGKMDYYELSTPLSTEHFGNYAGGQLYGIDHTVSRFEQEWMRPETPIKNLYVTGQDLLFCGVASALSSGVMTAASILGSAMAGVIPGFGKSKRLF